jgi:acyl-CoA reductase-like NAD-dependent aldehyde dehydrogenase
MAQPTLQTTIIPHSQEPYTTRVYPSIEQLDEVIQNALSAQKAWNAVSLADRIAIGRKFTVSTNLALSSPD